MVRKVICVLGMSVAAVLAITACSSGKSSTASSSAPAANASSPMDVSSAAPSSSSADASMATFGSGCSAVPTDASNPGSFDAMSKVPVATAASGNPLLSTLVTAVKAAGLVDTLNSAPALTVFAPDNAAFAKIPAATLNSVLANKAELTKILEYHVIGKRLTPSEVTGALTTLEMGTVTAAGSVPSLTVNGANVVCGNIQTANATVYIIDTVMMPAS